MIEIVKNTERLFENHKGLNTKDPTMLMEKGFSPNCWNCIFGDTGNIIKRDGFSKVTTTGIGETDKKVRWIGNANLKDFDSGTISKLVLALSNKRLYFLNVATLTQIGSGDTFATTNTDNYSIAVLKKMALIANGVDDIYKAFIKGGTKYLQRSGVDAPTSVLTAAVGAAPGLTGTYRYTYIYRNSLTGTKSNPCRSSEYGILYDEVVLANESCDLTIPYSAQTECDYIDIYRTMAGGVIYYYVATVANPGSGTASYNDTIADTALGSELILYNGDGLFMPREPFPTGAKCMITANGRVWASVGTNLYFSSITSEGSEPESMSPQAVRAIQAEDGFDIEAIAHVQPGIILIFKPSGTFAIDANNPTRSALAIVDEDKGVSGPHSVVNAGDKVIFWDMGGPQVTLGRKAKSIGEKLKDQYYTGSIYGIIDKVTKGSLGKIFSAYLRDREWVVFALPYDGTTDNKILIIYNNQLGWWSPWRINEPSASGRPEFFNSMASIEDTSTGEEEIWFGSDNGHLYRYGSGDYSDDGEGYTFVWESQDLSRLDQYQTYYDYLNVIYRELGIYALNVTHRVDNETDSEILNLTGSVKVWDATKTWDKNEKWGSTSKKYGEQQSFIGYAGDKYRFIIANSNPGQKIDVVGFELISKRSHVRMPLNAY